MATGSGAIVAYRALQANIDGYRLWEYDPSTPRFVASIPALRRYPADIVHASPDDAAFFTAPGRKLVVTFQNYVLDAFMRGHSSLAQRLHYRASLRLLTRLALRRATVVTAVSRFTADLVRRDLGFNGDIRVIHNGVDTELFHPPLRRSKGRRLRVLFAGNLTRRKGADVLRRIAEQVAAEVELVVAEGSRGLPKSYGLALGRLTRLGEVAHRDMPEVYRGVDVLVSPTVREGLSLSVLEAMASGLAVVASRASSLPEQIREGRGGYLCEIGSAREFAEKLARLAADRSLCREMGAFNRRRAVAAFTLHRMVDAYRDLFTELADR